MVWWLAFEKKQFQFWREIWIQVVVILLKLRFYEKDTKNLRNNHIRFVLCSNSQIYDGDFAKCRDLLRIYELYSCSMDSKVIHLSFLTSFRNFEDFIAGLLTLHFFNKLFYYAAHTLYNMNFENKRCVRYFAVRKIVN